MIYKFKSKASGDVIMLGPHGDQLLKVLGRDAAVQGIFEVAAMPALLLAIEAAIAAEGSGTQASAAGADSAKADTEGPAAVALRQRFWPMHEMLRRAHAAGEVVVWGV
jgi:hypothetical protein